MESIVKFLSTVPGSSHVLDFIKELQTSLRAAESDNKSLQVVLDDANSRADLKDLSLRKLTEKFSEVEKDRDSLKVKLESALSIISVKNQEIDVLGRALAQAKADSENAKYAQSGASDEQNAERLRREETEARLSKMVSDFREVYDHFKRICP